MNAALSARLLPALVVLVGMIAAPTIAAMLRPNEKLADHRPQLNFEQAIPPEFGEWRFNSNSVFTLVNPQQTELLGKLYSQTLSRSYTHKDGSQVMLSIAYGGDQRDSVQLHYPEVCYPAQGFQSGSNRKGMLQTRFGSVPVRRLVMSMGQRIEPITYWAMVGDYPSLGGINKKLLEMRYAVDGFVPDGLLFRVSTISSSIDASYALHDRFVDDLLAALPADARLRVSGLTEAR